MWLKIGRGGGEKRTKLPPQEEERKKGWSTGKNFASPAKLAGQNPKRKKQQEARSGRGVGRT